MRQKIIFAITQCTAIDADVNRINAPVSDEEDARNDVDEAEEEYENERRRLEEEMEIQRI